MPITAKISWPMVELTFVFVNPDDHYTFTAANTDKFVDGADTSSGQFTEQDHALYIVIF